MAAKSGTIYGLRILMHLKADQYLLSSDVVGAKVVVHDSKIEPMPELEGYSVAAGYRTSIGVVQIETNRLQVRPITKKLLLAYFLNHGCTSFQPPYGQCNSKTINVEKCLMDCHANKPKFLEDATVHCLVTV